MAICGTIIFFVAIRGTIIFFVAIRGEIIFFVAICGFTFELGLPQQSEIEYQPFFLDSPPFRGTMACQV
jgi:hypothetical protein